MGPSTSTSALAILDTVKDSALVCSGSNTAAQLTTAGPQRSGGLYFRTSPPDRLQGPALAELVLSDGHSNIGLISTTDSASKPLASSVARALEEGGAEVTHASFDPTAATTGGRGPAGAPQAAGRDRRDHRRGRGPQIVKALIDQRQRAERAPGVRQRRAVRPGVRRSRSTPRTRASSPTSGEPLLRQTPAAPTRRSTSRSRPRASTRSSRRTTTTARS